MVEKSSEVTPRSLEFESTEKLLAVKRELLSACSEVDAEVELCFPDEVLNVSVEFVKAGAFVH